MKKILLISSFFLSLYGNTFAQVTSNPVFPTSENLITIIYDATQANGELTGATKVYMHAGAILTSTNGTTWEYVKGNWGKDDGVGLMTQDPMNANRWSITITPRTYFGVPAGQKIYRIGMVFRNADASKKGKSITNEDIFLDLYEPGLYVKFTNPTSPYTIMENGMVSIQAACSQNATLTLYENNIQINQVIGATVLNYTLNVATTGKKIIKIVADNGMEQKESSFYIISRPAVTIEDLPSGIRDGINYIDDKTVILCLTAPAKNYIYTFGDFSNWEIDPAYYLKKTTDGKKWWIKLTNLTPQKEYAFQYLVDGNLRIADPFCDKVLDPWNDSYINNSTYPQLIPYPSEKTEGIVSIFQTNQTPYVWKKTNYTYPEKTDLVIYEILIRDFNTTHNYAALMEKLPYLQELGVNTLKLMPIMEFEGNESWGYNPSFYLAPDKYYGTKNDLKALIDKAHEMGFVVILDMVLNHAFGQCPLVQLYWDKTNNRPAANSPWFNSIATHPFNVGYDFNHESNYTKAIVDRITSYWLTDYKFDGFRFDLSKGFTQTNTGNDVDLWGKYDASRIAILKRMADEIWKVNPKAYVILEHFAENSEEKELADYGMLLWSNLNSSYGSAAKGFATGPIEYGFYAKKNWTSPHLINYMESHDEERMMYQALKQSTPYDGYDLRNTSIALDRMKLLAAFFFTIPGPKMIWQFGELGYDLSINQCPDESINANCRTANKPPKWEYLQDTERLKLKKVYEALIKLKTNQPVFKSKDVTFTTVGTFQSITIKDPSMTIHLIGNFGTKKEKITTEFPILNTTWYNYFSGEARKVISANSDIELNPGEFRLYTNIQLPLPTADIVTGLNEELELINNSNSIIPFYPNPSQEKLYIDNAKELPTDIQLKTTIGICLIEKKKSLKSTIEIDISCLASGIYFIEINQLGKKTTRPFIKL